MPNTHINILKGNLSTNNKEIKGSLTLPERVATSNYNELFNKPQINSVELNYCFGLVFAPFDYSGVKVARLMLNM